MLGAIVALVAVSIKTARDRLKQGILRLRRFIDPATQTIVYVNSQSFVEELKQEPPVDYKSIWEHVGRVEESIVHF